MAETTSKEIKKRVIKPVFKRGTRFAFCRGETIDFNSTVDFIGRSITFY